MIDASESLELELANDGYVLRRTDHTGAVTQLALSESNILSLPKLAHARAVQILENRSTPALKALGGQAGVWTSVAHGRIGQNLSQTAVLLEIEDAYGMKFGYALTAEQARVFSARLLEEADGLERAVPPTKQ